MSFENFDISFTDEEVEIVAELPFTNHRPSTSNSTGARSKLSLKYKKTPPKVIIYIYIYI